MHAIIETGGKQYRVEQGDTIYIEKLPLGAGDKVTFDKVLAVTDEGTATFGGPYIEGASVTANVEKNGKGKKVNVFKYKPKKGYRRRQGHRQPYTKVIVEEIKLSGTKVAPEGVTVDAAPAVKKPAAKSAGVTDAAAAKAPAKKAPAKKTEAAKAEV